MSEPEHARQDGERSSHSLRRVVRLAIPTLLWGLVAAGILYALFWAERSPADLEELDLAGVSEPHAVPATQSVLPEQDEVIGVTVNGKHRAYSVSTLSDITRHVVNDRVGETPIAVTYCDRSNCAKVFRGEANGQSLNVGIGGYLGTRAAGSLLLKLAGTRYRQDTGKAVGSAESLPLRESEITRTTWRQWRTEHPDSDVYDGSAEGQHHETR